MILANRCRIHRLGHAGGRHRWSADVADGVGTPDWFRPLVDVHLDRWNELGRPEAEAMVGACSHTQVAVDDSERWEPCYRSYWNFVGTLVPADRCQSFDFGS